jgi:hypothetical protein
VHIIPRNNRIEQSIHPERRRDRPCETAATFAKAKRCQFLQDILEDGRGEQVCCSLFPYSGERLFVCADAEGKEETAMIARNEGIDGMMMMCMMMCDNDGSPPGRVGVL